MPYNDKQFFYKYISAEAAKAILGSCSLQWSSPDKFNDPFDIQFDLNIPFSHHEYATTMMSRLIHIVRNGREGEINAETGTTRLFNAIFDRIRPLLVAKSDQEIAELFADQLLTGALRAQARLPETHAELRQILGDLSVFCVTEASDSLLMWSHYADSHRGALLKLKCLPEKDSALCVAEPVVYQKEMPTWGTVDEWVDSLFGKQPLTVEQMFKKMTLTKSEEWSYEREWRIVSSFRTAEQVEIGFANFPIHAEEIDEIVFGCRMPEADKSDLMRLLVAKFPHVQISEAVTKPTEFGLDYIPLNSRVT